jgi:hypothetical protein
MGRVRDKRAGLLRGEFGLAKLIKAIGKLDSVFWGIEEL